MKTVSEKHIVYYFLKESCTQNVEQNSSILELYKKQVPDLDKYRIFKNNYFSLKISKHDLEYFSNRLIKFY